MGLVRWPSAYLSIFDEVRVAVLEQRSMIEQRWELRNSILTSVFPVENVLLFLFIGILSANDGYNRWFEACWFGFLGSPYERIVT